MKRVRDRSSLPIALDEGCFSSYDRVRLARMEAGDLVVKQWRKARACGLPAAPSGLRHGLGLLGSGLTEIRV